jgi:hypothetical protein
MAGCNPLTLPHAYCAGEDGLSFQLILEAFMLTAGLGRIGFAENTHRQGQETLD